MKTRKLIELLIKEDPTGEYECCIDNEDIHFVDANPAYYDGRLEILERDENNKTSYNITGGKITAKGMKIRIRPLSLKDVLLEDPEAPIDLSEINDSSKETYVELVENWRKDGRIFNQKES